MTKFCPSCGASMPDDATFCGNCGSNAAAQAAPQAQPVTATPVNAAPVAGQPIAGWKTNVPMAIVGIVAFLIVNSFGRMDGFLMIIGAIYAIFAIVYVLAIYPKYFKQGLNGKSPALVSFLNTFVGSFIFGCLWNHNLTIGKKGISYIIYIVIQVVSFVFGFIAGIQGMTL